MLDETETVGVGGYAVAAVGDQQPQQRLGDFMFALERIAAGGNQDAARRAAILTARLRCAQDATTHGGLLVGFVVLTSLSALPRPGVLATLPGRLVIQAAVPRVAW